MQAIVRPTGYVILRDRTYRAAIGEHGVLQHKEEDDEATPAGVLPIRRVLYRADRVPPPHCAVPLEPIARDGGDLNAAHRQLLLYAGPLGNPPLLIVSDIERIEEIDAKLADAHMANAVSLRLATIPGVGPVTALTLAIEIDLAAFESGRHLAAWAGLTAEEHSTGGKQRMGGITRAGNERLRVLLVAGATSVINAAMRPSRKQMTDWLRALLQRKPRKLAAVALANKMARVAWALMTSGETYRRPLTVAEGQQAGHMIAVDPGVGLLILPLASEGPSTQSTEGSSYWPEGEMRVHARL